MESMLCDSLKGLKIESDGVNTMITADNRGIVVSSRDVPPAHYLLKIESFSKIGNTTYDSYESNPFEEGGYKWKLVVVPNGHETRDTKDQYLELYLEICDTESLDPGWEVYANLRLFVFDHIRNTYLSMQDAKGLQRFHQFKTQLGFDKFLPLSTLKDDSQGYLEDDCCVFGAEVFVIKPNGKGQCMSICSSPSDRTFTWTINNFSSLEDEFIYSEPLIFGDYEWKLVLFTRGDSEDNKYLSLYLELTDVTTSSEWEVNVEFKLGIRDQINGRHCYKTDVLNHVFIASSNKGDDPDSFGYSKFLSREDLYRASKGYLVKDTVRFEVEISYICTLANL